MTRCGVCGDVTMSGQSAHGQCGGNLPDDEREWAWACAHHVEKVLRRGPATVEQLRHQCRPEYRDDVLAIALQLLDGAGNVCRDGDTLRPAPQRRVVRRPRCDDGSADGLFALPERVRK
jgi:hypothetical protein